jgi:hypothetical protein
MSASSNGNDNHNCIDHNNNSNSSSNSNLAAAFEILKAHGVSVDDLPDPESYSQWKNLSDMTQLSIAHGMALKRYVTQLRAPQGNHSQRGNEENQENDGETIRFQELVVQSAIDNNNSIDHGNNRSSSSNSNLAAAFEILRAHDFHIDDLPDAGCTSEWKHLRECMLLSIAHCGALKRYVTLLRAPQGNHSQRGNEENQENDRETVRFQELVLQSVKETLKRISDKDAGKFYAICVR